MPFSAILDVGIGMALIFLTLSALCSSINEFIARFAKLRSRYLKDGIASLLSDSSPDLYGDVIRHPLIRRLGTDPREFPAYISADNFALALLDALRARAGGPAAMIARLQTEIQKITDGTIRKQIQDALSTPDARVALEEVRLALASIQDPIVRASIADFLSALEVNQVKQGILAIPDPAIQAVLLTLLSETNTQIQKLQDVKKRIEDWFDDGMARVSVQYKYAVEWILRGLAVGVCIAFNADAFQIATNLWHDPILRSALVSEAQVVSTTPPATSAGQQGLAQQVNVILQTIDQTSGLPLGWDCKTYNDIFRSGGQTGPVSSVPSSPGYCQVMTGVAVIGGTFSLTALIVKIIGLLLMSLGVSLGAPFWFEVITRIVPLRADKQRTT